MATSSQAKALLGGVPADLKAALFKVMDYVFDRNFAFGPIDNDVAQTPTTNLAGRYVKVTTNATANLETSIAHGLGRVPNVCWQVVSPAVANSQFIGDLTISRAADTARIYVTSATVGATLWLYVE